jgi:hypothetical protein
MGTEKNIEGLTKLLPSPNMIEALHGLRLFGNDAAHRLEALTRGNAHEAIEVMEHLLNHFYDMDYKASQVNNPRRSHSTPSSPVLCTKKRPSIRASLIPYSHSWKTPGALMSLHYGRSNARTSDIPHFVLWSDLSKKGLLSWNSMVAGTRDQLEKARRVEQKDMVEDDDDD